MLLRCGHLQARELTAFHLAHLGRLGARDAVRLLRVYAGKSWRLDNPSGFLAFHARSCWKLG